VTVGPDPGNGISQLGRPDRSDLAAGFDPRRGEAGVVEADGRFAAGRPAQQQ